ICFEPNPSGAGYLWIFCAVNGGCTLRPSRFARVLREPGSGRKLWWFHKQVANGNWPENPLQVILAPFTRLIYDARFLVASEPKQKPATFHINPPMAAQSLTQYLRLQVQERRCRSRSKKKQSSRSQRRRLVTSDRTGVCMQGISNASWMASAPVN